MTDAYRRVCEAVDDAREQPDDGAFMLFDSTPETPLDDITLDERKQRFWESPRRE